MRIEDIRLRNKLQCGLSGEDVDVLFAEIDRMHEDMDALRRSLALYVQIVDRQCIDVLNATGMHHVINENGDGDWGLVWDRLAEMGEKQ